MLPAFGSNITLIWLPTGIAVAALLRWGFCCWPGVTLGAVAVNLAVGPSLPVALAIAVGNTLGPLLAAWMLRRAGLHHAFDRKRDILFLSVAAIAGMFVSASLGVVSLSVAGLLPGGRMAAWLIWWAGDATGVVAAAPLVLASTSRETRVILLRRAEFVAWLCATGVVTWSVFVLNGSSHGGAWALAFLPLPMVAWAALRYGPVGTSVALIVISVGAAYGTATERGPFFRRQPIGGVTMLWIYMATSAVLGWLISALHAARVQATGIQRLFEQALSDVSLGVLLAGTDRRITHANEGFTRLTGYTEAELLGKSCSLLHGPETDPATVKRLKTAMEGDGYFDGEILNYRKDGTSFWNALLISPVCDAHGARTGFLGVQRDITVRKRLEQEREVYFKFFLLSTEPMCVADPFGCFKHVNPAFVRLTGFGEAELLGRPFLDFVLPEDRQLTADEMKLQVEVRPSLLFENRYVCKDGSVILLSWTASFNKADGVTYATARDITKLRQATVLLRESEERFRRIIDYAPEAIMLLDVASGRFIQVNPAAERLFKFPAAELCELGPLAVSPPVQPDGRLSSEKGPEFVSRAIAGETPVFEWMHRDAEGRDFPCEVRLLRIEVGGRVVVRGSTTDITGRKQAQIEREQLDRKVRETQKLESLGVLAGGIAHDFNNLLTTILGNASLAELDVAPGSPPQECLMQITEAAARAADLCKQMLAYSGRGRFVVQTLDLGRLVEQTAQMLQISISKKAVLRFRLENGLPPVEVDATQIRQVIMNLVINASEAVGDKSGVISISTGLTRVDRAYLAGTLMDPDLPEGEYVFLEVSDSGSGMSPETQAKIFDPFFTTKFTGRGLGLAAVLGIVRGHKGAMKLYSELGRGTTFKLR